MAEDGAGRELFLRRRCDAEKPLEIQVLDADVQPAVGILPLTARPVRVDLDAVALGIVEVEGLADQMIRGPGQGQPLFEGTLEEAPELLFTRQQDRKVIKARGVRRAFPTSWKRRQTQERRAARAQVGMLVAAADRRQSEPFVKPDLALEVKDLQVIFKSRDGDVPARRGL